MKKTEINADIEQLLENFGGDKDAAISAIMLHHSIEHPKKPTEYVAKTKTPILVKLENLSKHYRVGKQLVNALQDVNVEIHEREFVAITGPSGSGKSTLLQMIGGLDRPSEGIVSIDNKNISRLSDSKLSVFRNQSVGFIFQFFYLQPFLNLQTNIEVPAMFAKRKRPERHTQALKLADAVGLSDRLRHLPKELSGGQMQRAAIARAMLNSPKILLADEPTGNLDQANSQMIVDLFRKVRDEFGTTVVIVTHDQKVAAGADRVIEIVDGKVAI